MNKQGQRAAGWMVVADAMKAPAVVASGATWREAEEARACLSAQGEARTLSIESREACESRGLLADEAQALSP